MSRLVRQEPTPIGFANLINSVDVFFSHFPHSLVILTLEVILQREFPDRYETPDSQASAPLTPAWALGSCFLIHVQSARSLRCTALELALDFVQQPSMNAAR